MSLLGVMVCVTALVQVLSGEPPVEPTPPGQAPAVLAAEPTLEEPDLMMVDRVEMDALRGEVAALRTIADEIRETQVKEGSFVRKVFETYVIDYTYTILFGSGDGGTSILGWIIAVLGGLSTVLKICLLFNRLRSRKKNLPPGRREIIIDSVSTFIVAIVLTCFIVFAFSRGKPTALEEAREAKIAILETTVRLEEAIDTRLRLIDERLAAVGIDGERGEPPQGPLDTRPAMHAELLAELAAIKASSEVAAEKATEAAGHSTGWGWHFVICVLIVIGFVVVALLQIASSPTLQQSLGFR